MKTWPKGKPALVVLVEGDKPLLNQYSVIPVNPEKCKAAKAEAAEKFRQWLASPQGAEDRGGFHGQGQEAVYPQRRAIGAGNVFLTVRP